MSNFAEIHDALGRLRTTLVKAGMGDRIRIEFERRDDGMRFMNMVPRDPYLRVDRGHESNNPLFVCSIDGVAFDVPRNDRHYDRRIRYD